MTTWAKNDSNLADGLFTNNSECEKYLKNLATEQDSNETGEFSSRMVKKQQKTFIKKSF